MDRDEQIDALTTQNEELNRRVASLWEFIQSQCREQWTRATTCPTCAPLMAQQAESIRKAHETLKALGRHSRAVSTKAVLDAAHLGAPDHVLVEWDGSRWHCGNCGEPFNALSIAVE